MTSSHAAVVARSNRSAHDEKLAVLGQAYKITYPNTTLDIPIVALSKRICLVVVRIRVCRPLARLEKRISWPPIDCLLGIVTDNLVTRALLGAGAASTEEGDVAAGHRDAAAGTSDGNRIAVDVGNVKAGTIVLRGAEGDLNLGVGWIKGFTDEDSACVMKMAVSRCSHSR